MIPRAPEIVEIIIMYTLEYLFSESLKTIVFHAFPAHRAVPKAGMSVGPPSSVPSAGSTSTLQWKQYGKAHYGHTTRLEITLLAH